MLKFLPDLVVEVTSVCNKACKGCYAPNVVSTKAAKDIFKESSSLFLDTSVLRTVVERWTYELPQTISIRGGEPSLHPSLDEIIITLKNLSNSIILETHGKWLLDKDLEEYSKLVSSIREVEGIVKISFDSMHGSQESELKEMIRILDKEGISYFIAITEETEEMFNVTRNKCSWINDSKIIFQPKSQSSENLLKPILGVINVRGQVKGQLSSKFILNNIPVLNELIEEAL